MSNRLMSIYYPQLTESIDSSETTLDKFRELNKLFIATYAGDSYMKKGDTGLIINHIEMLINIYDALLCPTLPFCEVTSPFEQAKIFAYELQLTLGEYAEKAQLDKTINSVILDSMFMIGIMKVGLQYVDVIDGYAAGEFYAQRVSLDRYFCDMSADSREEMQYEGNSYYLTDEEIKLQFNYDIAKRGLDREDKVDRADRVSSNFVTESDDVTEYKKRYLVRDVYLPKKKKLITYLVAHDIILADRAWEMDFGPYLTLGMATVPNNVMPLSPVAVLFSIMNKTNELYDKCYCQAMDQKNITIFTNGDTKAAEDFNEADDSDAISATGNTKPTTVGTAGVQQPTFMLAMKLNDELSEVGGNLKTLGGLGQDADTAAQEKIISGNAGLSMGNKKRKVLEFVKLVYRSLAYFIWDDPDLEVNIHKPIGKTDLSIDKVWSMDQTEGDFEDWDFKFNVITEPDNSSNGRLGRLLGTMERVIYPNQQYINQAGGQINFRTFIELLAKLQYLPELNSVVSFNNEPAAPMMGMNGQSGGYTPPGQEKVYKHVGAKGASDKSKDMAYMMDASGKNSQPAEKARMFE